ncbi:MAG: hypothetical protein ACOC5S_01435 [Acidobacteriota bacterium]
MKKYKKLIGLIAFFLFSVTFLSAQIIYYPYYGKNIIRYKDFNWESYKTDHFEIYYYMEDVEFLKTIAELAESAYDHLSKKVKHQLSAEVPILYYKTSTDFQQTNLFNMPEGVLGVAEPILYRIALYGDMPVDELEDLVIHELTHIFEYDMLWGSPGGALHAVSSPPLWIMEGFSEYNTKKWSSWSKLIVKDTVLNDRIPEMRKDGDLYSRYPLPRDPAYDFGHAIYEYIEHKYGENGVRNLWQSMKNIPLIGQINPIQKCFDMEPKEFNQEFNKYLREKYKPFLMRENPENYSLPLGPNYPVNEYYFAFSHSLSPSGELIAALVVNLKASDYDIILFSTKDGKFIKNLTKGYTLKYWNIKYEIEPSRGRDVAWSPDGDKIAFFGRSGEKHSLYLINILNSHIIKKIKIPEDRPTAPAFTADGERVLYTAFVNGIHDIFRVSLSTEETKNLTNNELYEKAPAVSPDGKSMAYTIRIGQYDKLFLSPVDDLNKRTQLTFGKGNTICPEFSRDSSLIYFSGDMRDAYNIYSLSLDHGELKRYTDVRTGNFFPSPMPHKENTLVFSSFHKGAFQIFKSELEGIFEKNIRFNDMLTAEEYEEYKPHITVEIDESKIKPYKGIGNLYLTGRPPIDTTIATDGSIYGGSSISFSDLFGDHNFNVTAYQVRDFRSYYFSYLNQKNRFQYQASAYHYTLFYYTPYSYIDPTYYYYLNYNDALAKRSISGANISGYYPLNRYYRAQASLQYSYYNEEFYDPSLARYMASRGQSFGYFLTGNIVSTSFSLTGETTHFKYYGPAAGNTFRLSVSQAIPITENFLSNTTLQLDFRKYFYLGFDTLFAFRFEGFGSWGKTPFINYFGGNNQVRSQYYYSLIGTESWFSNLEFRFPIVNSASTIIGQLGPVRGTLFFDVARTKVKGYESKMWIYDTLKSGDIYYYVVDAVGSLGYGFEFFLLGFPVHIDFVKLVYWPDFSNPFDLKTGESWRTKFWIGFDF